MRVDFHALSSVLAALVLASATGCAAQHDETARLSEELSRARSQADWERSRAAQVEARAALLDARIAQLEQKSRDTAGASAAEQSRLLSRLDRLTDVTERLLEERAQERVTTEEELVAPSSKPTSNAARDLSALSPDQRLRALAEALLAAPGGVEGLTRDQERALRLLLRAERKLDSRNPWPSALR